MSICRLPGKAHISRPRILEKLNHTPDQTRRWCRKMNTIPTSKNFCGYTGKGEPIRLTPGTHRRVVIEHVTPEIDGGRYPVKRVVGETLTVEADVFGDGHDIVWCGLRYRHETDSVWSVTPMHAFTAEVAEDRWQGTFSVEKTGSYSYTIVAGVDHFATWRRDLSLNAAAGKDLSLDFAEGAKFAEFAQSQAQDEDAEQLAEFAGRLRSSPAREDGLALVTGSELAHLVTKYRDSTEDTLYSRSLQVTVDRPRARFSTWYEMFPRSLRVSHENGHHPENLPAHGTFASCETALPYIAGMGFDVLYLPPIHPIGKIARKGSNNAITAQEGDLGSPWAIGSTEGGHTAVHPALGTIDDFRSFRKRAEDFGIEIALDLAFQCAPDHPWVQEHPNWFRHRADGSVKCAENPPKSYEDIYPFDFECEDSAALWRALREVVDFWVDQGVRIFRVDNPHTKPFPFWDWLIPEVKRSCPDVLFLAEAFTRPKLMHRLAKAGFTQSYTYFTWRNTKWELTEYFTELTKDESREIFRPNVWTNTPDILHEFLRQGGKSAFMVRFILAATLAANYGIYGPVFELAVTEAAAWREEEYQDSEKYQIRTWDLDQEHNMRDLISQVNFIRRENPALQQDWTLQFHHIDNDQLICYSKTTPVEGPGDQPSNQNVVLTVVNLDPQHTQSGWVHLDLEALAVTHQNFTLTDLLDGTRYTWHGPWNYVELHPGTHPAHIFRIHNFP